MGEEAERARQAKVSDEQRARQSKKEEASKSLLALEIKPWEAETDLLACLEEIRKIDIKGCEWSASHKLIPVAFGIKKLLITATIQDSICPYTDDVTEAIENLEDYVQSVDVVAFNKL